MGCFEHNKLKFYLKMVSSVLLVVQNDVQKDTHIINNQEQIVKCKLKEKARKDYKYILVWINNPTVILEKPPKTRS